jgi:soluble lytic murein transglycosylase-like protein
MTRLSRKLAFVMLTALSLAAVPALAADLAVLHNGFSIRHERREVNGTVTRLYLAAGDSGYVEVPSSQIDHFEKDLMPVSLSPASPANLNQVNLNQVRLNVAGLNQPGLDEVVAEASSRHQLDPDLVNSVIRAESGFNVRAVSPKGAQGLMQLMPYTASQLGVANAFDPQANVEGGTQYLRALLEQYNFDLVKALAAYNAGPQRVARYGGVPPYYETQAYVARIVRDFNRKKLAERKSLVAAQTKSRKTPVPPHSTASASLSQGATP